MTKHLCLVLLAAAGCAGGDDPSVVGEWRVIDNAFVADGGVVVGPSVWTFRDDGTLALDDVEGSTYEIEGDRIVAHLGDGTTEPWVLETGFVVTEDRLLLAALFPEGDADGAVGTWSGVWRSNDEVEHVSLTLDGDGAATCDQGAERGAGTWKEDGESLLLELDVGDKYWFRLDERGIGDWLAERID